MKVHASIFVGFWATLLAPLALMLSGGCVSRLDPTHGALLVPALPLLRLGHRMGWDSGLADSICVGLSYGIGCLLLGAVIDRLWQGAKGLYAAFAAAPLPD